MAEVVIHTNPRLEHQVKWAGFLAEGISAHGDSARITANKSAPGDFHIVQGPWYCKQEWQGQPNVVLLDRCFWGHSFEHVSLGWLQPDGSTHIAGSAGRNRDKPELQPWKTRERSVLVMGDYGCRMEQELKWARMSWDAVYFRPHPAEPGRPAQDVMSLNGPLAEALELADVVIGRETTGLIQAAIAGAPVICLGATNPVLPVASHELDAPLVRGDRDAWLDALSWHNWHMTETRDAWQHLKRIL